MRITAGSMRGRVMHVPEVKGLRPTPSKVRQALFNMLGNIEGQSVLDLFAGSGVMSLEALSRGASFALSIEQDDKACAAMDKIKTTWPVDNWKIVRGKLPSQLEGAQIERSQVEQGGRGAHFDMVFADPPYHQGLTAQVPKWLAKANITYHTLVVEEASSERIDWQGASQPYKQKKYGDTTLYFFESSAPPNTQAYSQESE